MADIEAGRTSKQYIEYTPLDLRREFRSDWSNYAKGNLPMPSEGQEVGDATKLVEAYEVLVDPTSPGERYHYTVTFALQAKNAGFELSSVIVVPGVGYKEDGKPLTSVTYILTEPQENHPS